MGLQKVLGCSQSEAMACSHDYSWEQECPGLCRYSTVSKWYWLLMFQLQRTNDTALTYSKHHYSLPIQHVSITSDPTRSMWVQNPAVSFDQRCRRLTLTTVFSPMTSQACQQTGSTQLHITNQSVPFLWTHESSSNDKVSHPALLSCMDHCHCFCQQSPHSSPDLLDPCHELFHTHTHTQGWHTQTTPCRLHTNNPQSISFS
jgi:hypothetical protein